MAMSQLDTPYDVLVIGAGPSGLATAIAAARFGARVLLVEKHPEVSIFPKATGIRGRSMEIIRSWGLEDKVRAVDMALPLTMAIAETLSQPAQEVSLGLPPLGLSRTASPTNVAVVPQDYLEPILLDHFHDVGGESRFGTELSSFSMDDDLVRAELRSRDSGDCYQVRARYIVGGDGRRSLVRDQLGIELAPLGMEGVHLATLFEADLAPSVNHRLCVLHAVMKPTVEGVFVPTGTGRWVYDMELESGVTEAAAWWTPERLAERIRTAAGVPDLAMNIEATFRWDFSAAVATRYQYGRAFLVGDAAHGTTPRGATGMNTGIADGHNLGWKLAWVSRGWAHETLLDSYQDERGPVGRRNASRSMESRIGGSAESSLAADFGVTYGSTVITGGQTGELDFEDVGRRARPGERAPHAWVDVHGKRLSTIDLFDGHLTLMIGAAGEAWRAAATMLPSGPPFQVLAVGTEISDPTGELVQRYGLAGTAAVLVRPDGYVSWSSQAAEHDIGETLRRAVTQSLGESVPAAARLVAVA
jgi:2-polyprenyl-6-methoxyphenol hydroxylase-like FAD-dependent oxidoreductase